MNLKSQTSIAGILYIIFGILCIAFRGGIISFAGICLGAAFLVFGIVNIIREELPVGIVLAIIGVVILLAGKFFIAALFYIVAVILILTGIQRLYVFFKTRAVNDSILRPEGIRPIVLIIVGLLFLIYQRGTISIIFVAIGILFIVTGILAIADSN